ncbi:MAG: NAD(P)-dependent oxidoreductase [Alicyclobacillaceae bacterium]|nr:NAD(P)-dependent oxidoreductase [Alicyclobacillaceae bacterium]
MTRVGITGGAGYIGSRATVYFQEKGFDVRVLDLRPPKVPVEWVKGDVRDPDALARFCQSLDYLVDLAAVSSVPECAENPEHCVSVNAWRGPLFAALARHSPSLAGYLFPSTCAPLFAGYPSATEIRENTPPKPKTAYALSKLLGEQAVALLGRIWDIPVTVVRQSNVYGPSPSWPPASVVAAFFESAIRRGEIAVHGNGKQTRSFLYIDDLLEAYADFLHHRFDPGGPYHLVGFTHPVREAASRVAEAVARGCGISVKVRYTRRVLPESEDLVYREGCLSEKGWIAKVDLEEGIRKTFCWLQQTGRVTR